MRRNILTNLAFNVGLCVGFCATAAQGKCQSTGEDYEDGGSYLIDATSNNGFTFISKFQGCGNYTVKPILRDPDGREYTCSGVRTWPDGVSQFSTCDTPYSTMKQGVWHVFLNSPYFDFSVDRTFTVIPSTDLE
ncbi:hypothetical protein F5Y15DRAFT_414284 [Xylariaceae sp. FL0016]|nr:hypothetical protein F5Y15DRAFT_414284 [Xylariaceae sp. FL0016]